MYSLSWWSCSLWVLMYCHRALMMTGRVWVWTPRIRAKRGSSLNWGGCNTRIGKSQSYCSTFFNWGGCNTKIGKPQSYCSTLFNWGWCNTFLGVLVIPDSQASEGQCILHSGHPGVWLGIHLFPVWWVSYATVINQKQKISISALNPGLDGNLILLNFIRNLLIIFTLQ